MLSKVINIRLKRIFICVIKGMFTLEIRGRCYKNFMVLCDRLWYSERPCLSRNLCHNHTDILSYRYLITLPSRQREINHSHLYFSCILISFSAPIFLKICKLILWKNEVFCYVCRPEGINFQFKRIDEWNHVPWIGVGGQFCGSWKWLTATG